MTTWGSSLALGASLCSHRQHRQLDRLRSLRLDNNRLVHLVFNGGDAYLLSSDDGSTSSSRGSIGGPAASPKSLAVCTRQMLSGFGVLKHLTNWLELLMSLPHSHGYVDRDSRRNLCILNIFSSSVMTAYMTVT